MSECTRRHLYRGGGVGLAVRGGDGAGLWGDGGLDGVCERGTTGCGGHGVLFVEGGEEVIVDDGEGWAACRGGEGAVVVVVVGEGEQRRRLEEDLGESHGRRRVASDKSRVRNGGHSEMR